MHKFLAVTLAGITAAVLSAAQGGSGAVEVKGPHICCKQCVNVVTKILSKVDGVSDGKADAKSKTVTFTAKDEGAAKAGFKALIEGGFFGTATLAGKEMKIDVATPKKGEKADVVTVKDVHVCCGQCENAVKGIFKDSKVSFEGSGAQRTVKVEGKGLETADVIESLHKTGFHGKVEK